MDEETIQGIPFWWTFIIQWYAFINVWKIISSSSADYNGDFAAINIIFL